MGRQISHTIRKSCSINLGLCRLGSSNLRFAFEYLGFSVHEDKFSCKRSTLKELLNNPEGTVLRWWTEGNGKGFFLSIVRQYHLIYGGWVPFILFLPKEELIHLVSAGLGEGVKINFVVTTRDVDSYIDHELHHWVKHNLEIESELGYEERENLEALLKTRFLAHSSRLNSLMEYLRREQEFGPLLHILSPESGKPTWSGALSKFSWPSEREWNNALQSARRKTGNHSLPVEGILITLRIKNNHHICESIHELLDNIEKDRLCQYLLVIALDTDESNSVIARNLFHSVASRSKILSIHTLENPQGNLEEPFQLCQVWHSMAEVAWSKGADWVLLFGDDVSLECPFHYRAIYRSFLDISQRLKCPFGFGAPWLNDESFPGFPTFPVISKVHHQIFGGLIPYHRAAKFVNQDLDPYLHRLYIKFNAAPVLSHVKIRNTIGGDISRPSRYKRVSAVGWRDWVMQDTRPIQNFLHLHSKEMREQTIVDVVVPTYRLQLQYLRRICAIRIPKSFETTFVVVVDNPKLLVTIFGDGYEEGRYTTSSIAFASKQLEKDLQEYSVSENGGDGNSVRVYSNNTNLGASASRNRGLEESSAEYVLFLDDDVIPDQNLLGAYEGELSSIRKSMTENDLLGMIGHVQFPRRSDMPLKHAAVLSSHLHAMYEIAKSQYHRTPAWGVSANLMVKRLPRLRFDQSYAKAGGGEDIDFCLNLHKRGGFFKAVESASVVHDFWEGSAILLATRFFRWALSDSEVFNRFPEHRHLSWPNLVECFFLVLSCWVMSFSVSLYHVVVLLLSFLVADCVVDLVDYELFLGRCATFEKPCSFWFSVASQVLGNLYIVTLESGRFLGHLRALNVQNMFYRFDWHCGRLPNSVTMFRNRELRKFVLFVVIAIGISGLH